MKYNKGFTLTELSIVILVIGLITSVVIVGKDLINLSETRKVVQELQYYKNAVDAFRDKYKSPAGDFNKATQFWSNTAVGTLNGDGNGITGIGGEDALAFNHLGNAGFINTMYSPNISFIKNDFEISTVYTPGYNVPAGPTPTSFYTYSSWSYLYFSNGSTYYPSGAYPTQYPEGGEAIVLGADRIDPGQTLSAGLPVYSAISPKMAKEIDQKIDDGVSSTGLFFAMQGLEDTSVARCTTTQGWYFTPGGIFGGDYYIPDDAAANRISCVVGFGVTKSEWFGNSGPSTE